MNYSWMSWFPLNNIQPTRSVKHLNPRVKGLCALVAVSLASVSLPAAAEGQNVSDDAEREPFFSTFKIQRVSTDFDNIDDAFNVVGGGGLTLPGELSWLGGELEISQTVVPGENTTTGGFLGNQKIAIVTPPGGGGGDGGGNDGGNDQPNNSQTRDDFGYTAAGLYATARSPGQFYAGTRVGYVVLLNSSIPEFESESGFSYSGMLGARFGPISLELEYNQVVSDLDALSLNVLYGF